MPPGMSLSARLLMAGLLVLTIVLFPSRMCTQLSELSDDAVKAGFLFNFAQFATWPAGRAGAGDRIAFCVEDGAIDPSVFAGWGNGNDGQRSMPPLFFRAEEVASTPARCDIAYLGAATAGDGIDILQTVSRQHHVLMVSDTEGFAARGGHIELYLDGGQYRFRINLKELDRSGVGMSSKVLRLADIVGAE
jgi:hypothetical protein